MTPPPVEPPQDHRAVPDADVRERALDPSTSFIVQAPAGSGKTTLLATRFLRLLTSVDQPEEILAITFTKKAAGEMRQRILSMLEEDTALAATVVARNAALGWQLTTNPNRLKIQTIDAFAMELTSHSGSGVNTQGMQIHEDATQFYEQASYNLFARLFEEDPSNVVIADFLAFFANDIGNATGLLTNMLKRRDQWLDLVLSVAGTLNDRGAQAVQALIEPAVGALRDGVIEQLQNALTADDDHHIETLATAWHVDNGLAAVLPRLLTARGQLRKRLTKSEQVGDPQVTRQLSQWVAQLHDRGVAPLIERFCRLPAARLEAGQVDTLHVLSVGLALAARELALILQRTNSLDFPGLLLNAKGALGASDAPTDLAMILDYKINHILVDEFQDTSRAQLDFFEKLTVAWQPGDGKTIFVVGDPMQSIYRFRDADVTIFSECQASGIGSVPLERCALQANFRSTPPLVDWCNAVFSDLFSGNDALRGDIPHNPAIAMLPEQAVSVNEVAARRFESSEEEVAAIVAHVQRLLDDDGASTIGVLCRARLHVQALLQAFDLAGIAWHGTELDLLSEKPVVMDLMNLHRLLLRPLDPLPWAATLRSPACGLGLTELTRLLEIHPTLPQALDAVVADSDPRLRRIATAYTWAQERLYERPLREVMEGLWLRCGGLEAYGPENLPHIHDWFDLIDTLADDAYTPATLELEVNRLYATSNPPESGGYVEVMTLFKAKGLEFDHVVVPHLDQAVRPDGPTALKWQSTHAGLLLGAREDGIYKWLGHEETQRATSEEKRLLYVACTRARLSLLVSFVQPEGDNPQRLAKWLAAHAQAGPPTVTRPTMAPSQGDLFDAKTAPLLRSLPLDYVWQPPQYTTLPGATGHRQAREAIAATFEIALGNLVHAALEWLAAHHRAWSNDDAHHNKALRALESQWPAWLREQRAAPEDLAKLNEQAIAHISIVLNDTTGQWLLAARTEAFSEHALTGVIDGEVKHAVIDRLFVEDDVCWIVDYKTAQPQAGESFESFERREAARYSTQLHTYRQLAASLFEAPVRTALYFTAIPRFHEVRQT